MCETSDDSRRVPGRQQQAPAQRVRCRRRHNGLDCGQRPSPESLREVHRWKGFFRAAPLNASKWSSATGLQPGRRSELFCFEYLQSVRMLQEVDWT